MTRLYNERGVIGVLGAEFTYSEPGLFTCGTLVKALH